MVCMIAFLIEPTQKPPQETKLLVDGTVFHTFFTKIINKVRYAIFIKLVKGELFVESK